MPLLTTLNYELRCLRKSPLFVSIAVSSLALGIGVNVTVYSVVREMIVDDVSARQPDRLVTFHDTTSAAVYREIRHSGVFQNLACFTFGNSDWDAGGHNEIAWQIATSANFFDVLGVAASIGRVYSQADEGLFVAVVSYGFWRRRLDSDPNVLGRALTVGGNLYTVVGVLPRDYRSVMRHGISPEVYILAGKDAARCLPFGRLRDGFTRNQTQQALIAAARNIGGQDLAKQLFSLRPMAGWDANAAGVGDDRRFFVFFAMLYATALMLLLIGCVNAAGLLLARGITRQRELAVRKALGASRFALARQILSEGLVIVGLASAVALVIDAFLRSRLSYVSWPSAYNLPFEFHFQTDRSLLLYALAAAFVALLLSSLLPTLRGSDADLSLAMKRNEPNFSVRQWNLRNGFVALQVVLSVVLLSLGALFCRTFWQIAHLDPGFDTTHTVMVTVWPPQPRRPDENEWAWRDGIIRRIKEVPGLIGVTSIGTLPFMGELPQSSIRRKGDPLSGTVNAYSMGAGEQFSNVLGIPILSGRDFIVSDRTRQPAPVLINQTLSKRLFGDANPVGTQLLIGRENERAVEIVGVVADTRMRTLGEDHAPMFFTPYTYTQMIVRTSGNAAQWIKPLRDVLAGAEPGSALDIRPLSDAAAGAIFPMRVAAGFVGSMSFVGLVLALIGLSSSVWYATQRRTREMAIRAAMGATRSAILWAAIKDSVALLTCGIAVGLPLAVAAIRPLTGLLPDGLNPWDPATFAAVAGTLVAAGIGAAWVPARRAANVDPCVALREE